jgi:hypothetical protein
MKMNVLALLLILLGQAVKYVLLASVGYKRNMEIAFLLRGNSNGTCI